MKDEVRPQLPQFVKEINPGMRDYIYWRVLGECVIEADAPERGEKGTIIQSLSALNPYDKLLIVPNRNMYAKFNPTCPAEYIVDKLQPCEVMSKVKVIGDLFNGTINLLYDTRSQKTTSTCLAQWVSKLEYVVKDIPHLMQFLPLTIQCFTSGQTEEPFMTLNFIQGSEQANNVRTINIA